MNNALKGLLLSGLVIPGLGQLVMKRYTRGILLMTAVIAGLVILAVKIIQVSLVILAGIQDMTTTLTPADVVNIAWQATVNSRGISFSLLFLMLLICWVYGMVDAYMIGRELDGKSVDQGNDDKKSR